MAATLLLTGVEFVLLQRAFATWEASGDPLTLDELEFSDPGPGRPFAELEPLLEDAESRLPLVSDLMDGPPYPWDEADDWPVELDPRLEDQVAALKSIAADETRHVTIDGEIQVEGVPLWELAYPEESRAMWTVLDRGQLPEAGGAVARLLTIERLARAPLLELTQVLVAASGIDWEQRTENALASEWGLFVEDPAMLADLQFALITETLDRTAEGRSAGEIGASLQAGMRPWLLYDGAPEVRGYLMQSFLFGHWWRALGVVHTHVDRATLEAIERDLLATDWASGLEHALVASRVLDDEDWRSSLAHGNLSAGHPANPVLRIRGRRVAIEHSTRAIEDFREHGLTSAGFELEESDLLPSGARSGKYHLLLDIARSNEARRRLALCGLAFELRGEAALEVSLERYPDPRHDRRFERLLRSDGLTVLRSADPRPIPADLGTDGEPPYDWEFDHLDWPIESAGSNPESGER